MQMKEKVIGSESMRAVRAIQTLQALVSGQPDNTCLFPVKEETLRAIVKRAAVALQWPSGLVWDGPHCLRHGGVAEVIAAQPWLHQSPSTIVHYARNNATRKRPRNEVNS